MERRRAVGIQHAHADQQPRKRVGDVRLFAMLAVDMLNEPQDVIALAAGKTQSQF